jgi:hypothetical protein
MQNRLSSTGRRIIKEREGNMGYVGKIGSSKYVERARATDSVKDGARRTPKAAFKLPRPVKIPPPPSPSQANAVKP